MTDPMSFPGFAGSSFLISGRLARSVDIRRLLSGGASVSACSFRAGNFTYVINGLRQRL